MPAGRWPDKREQAFFALKTLRCERVFPFALKTAAPLSALEIIDGPTLKAQRVECQRKEVAPTLSRPLRGLRQGVAHLPSRSKRFAVSTLELSTPRQSHAILLIETEGQSDLTF